MIDALEHSLAQRMSPGATYQACVDWLLDTPQQQGRLSYVQAQLNAVPPTVYDVTRHACRLILQRPTASRACGKESSGQLAGSRRRDVLREAHEVVLALADGATSCPACGTGLSDVTQDPFVKARAGLNSLHNWPPSSSAKSPFGRR